MKLSEIERFALESEAHASGAMSVSLFVLEGKKVDTGSQRQTHVINVVHDGKDETEATQKGLELALSKLEALKEYAPVVKLGVMKLTENAKGSVSCQVQLGLFEKSEEGADLILKRGFGFGEGKDLLRAQHAALESALKLMGVK